MPAPPKNVPKVPEITDSLLEANEREQELWRDQFAFTSGTADGYAGMIVRDNLIVLDYLDRQLSHAKRGQTREIREKQKQLRGDTAAWAASIGRFRLAAKLATDARTRREYESYAVAEERPDDEWCAHPIFEFIDGRPSQVAYRELDFFSATHARTVSMVRCGTCGFRNARDLDEDLRKLQRHRAEAVKSGKDEHRDLSRVIS